MKKIIILITILILGVVFILGYTKAAYVSNSMWDYYLNSKGFYFESDYLGDNKINTYNLWNGKAVSFNIKNNNSTNYNTDTLVYDIECIVPSGIKCNLSKTSSSLSGSSKQEEVLSFELVSDDNIKDVDVIIKASSTKPYKKTITGTFKLHRATSEIGNINYDLIHYNNYSLLNISNYYNQDKCVYIKWNNSDIKVLANDIDATSTDDNGYINGFNVNITENTTKSIRFYNIGTDNYTKDIFDIGQC